MIEKADKFTKKRAVKASKKQFIQILEYVVYCYNSLKKDNVTYSMMYCKKATKFAFEDYLKIKFVEDYLQALKGYFRYPQIKQILFLYEPQKTYKDISGLERPDKIDIFIGNLGLQSYWNDITEENIYFAIECKRLKNNSKNAKYITDIQKFVERDHKFFRFPFEGMIGFIEKSNIPIEDIINDINRRLKEHPSISTTQELKPFPISDFDYCRVSEHDKKNSATISIEVYHLFFDYSNIIIP